MNLNVPRGAAILLDFIGNTEAPKGYGTIYANKQDRLPKPLTEMTLDEVQAAQVRWSKNHGSSAAGRYQFMRATLRGLIAEMGLRGSQRMTPDLQDAMAYHLLKRRHYDLFVAGRMTVVAFGLELAKEWASFPVLADTQGQKRRVARGMSYYAGDGLNKALVKPGDVESVLAEVLNEASRKPAQPAPAPAKPLPTPEPQTPAGGDPDGKRGLIGWLVLAAVGIASLAAAGWQHVANFFGGLI